MAHNLLLKILFLVNLKTGENRILGIMMELISVC